MLNLKENAFSPIVIIIIVLVGLAATSFLILKPAIFKSKADEVKIPMSDKKESSGSAKPVDSTHSALPNPSPIVLTTPDPEIRTVSSPSPKPTPAQTPIPTSTPTPKPSPTAIPTTTPSPIPTQAPVSTGKPQLSLSPSTGTFSKSCNFALDIELETAGNQTDGSDIILTFDASKLNVISITAGSIYENYPQPYFDNLAGRIIISGFPSIGGSYAGKGLFARINFTVKSSAQTKNTQIKFDFDSSDKTKTIDSNIIQKGTSLEILDSVIDGNYSIGNGSC